MKAISLHSIVPLRAEAREGSEQETQMLFGELCEITDELKNGAGYGHWYRVRLEEDGQEGWVDAKMITPMTDKEYLAYREELKSAAIVVYPMVYAVSENNGQTIPLTAGTRLTKYTEGRFEVLGVGFRIDAAMVETKPMELTQPNLLQVIRFFLNVPYLWGGKNALGMDCSGFCQIIMSIFGKSLPRNASEQICCGNPVTRLEDAQAGDLVFFDHKDKKISHVGILLDHERVVHCSGRVKVEKIDHKGILSVEFADNTHPDGQYTHHTAAIRRV